MAKVLGLHLEFQRRQEKGSQNESRPTCVGQTIELEISRLSSIIRLPGPAQLQSPRLRKNGDRKKRGWTVFFGKFNT